MRYKAYLFDVQGTLLDFYTPVSRAVARYLTGAGVSTDRAGDLTRAWRRDYFERVGALAAGPGEPSPEKWVHVQDLYAAGFADVCADAGVPAPDAAAASVVAAGWQRLIAWPDVAAGLATLRADAAIATLSNTDMSTMVNIFKHLGISWDAIFTAELFGRFKPDPVVYRRALGYLGVEPGQAAMVASHPYDLRAAREVGMGTVFVYRPDEYGDADLAHSDAAGEFDHRVRAIGEIE